MHARHIRSNIKQLMDEAFCDIRNNQGRGKATVDNIYREEYKEKLTESHATQFDITLLEIMHCVHNLQISHQSPSP